MNEQSKSNKLRYRELLCVGEREDGDERETNWISEEGGLRLGADWVRVLEKLQGYMPRFFGEPRHITPVTSELPCQSENFRSYRGYMADHPHSSGDEAPPTKITRGPTRMKQLFIRKNSGERTPVNVNVTTGVATGPHADDFRSYLGVVARNKISILIPSFDHVSEGDRNIIWQDILMTFDIPNVPTLRNKCLSTVAENFRNFKSKLTSRYIFGHLNHKSPCNAYKSIDEETWRVFKESRMSEEWQAAVPFTTAAYSAAYIPRLEPRHKVPDLLSRLNMSRFKNRDV
ncbi:hypothetical protein LR48_Vigan358s000700 [Vigna angularis]|uniref:Uncharacterized protein n=1 Tax=Phaseolus angularis TaxID=3914 RepID=A0A0L9TA86_PHAAN|nr:hypothetical protein LR48_Vigan358s000700 [Vigna angularis]